MSASGLKVEYVKPREDISQEEDHARLALPEIKREIIQTCVRTLSYDGKTLKIELFPIFYKLKYWKNVKNGAGNRF